MKKLLVVLIPLGLLAGGSSSCVFVKHDNGNHKGWYKNRHNPHHPNSNNPGHAQQKAKPGSGNPQQKGKGKAK